MPSDQKFQSNSLEHIIPIKFETVQKVPDTHTWTPSGEYSVLRDVSDTEPVPIIDLEDQNVVSLIGRACETWGVFQVINHGISMSLFKDVETEIQRLFSLPSENKMKVLRSPGSMTGYGKHAISPFFMKSMWSEGFTVGDSPVEHARQLWPEDYMKFCDTIDEYRDKTNKLCNKLLWLILSSLGITKEVVEWAGATENNSLAPLQLNSYPICTDPDRAIGLAEHTDSSLFTVLNQVGYSGLEVIRDGLGRAKVPLVEGTLIINLGDMFDVLSNGRYKSIIHRVVVNQTHHRYSTAYFYFPPKDVKISPLMKLVDPAHPLMYRSVTGTEFLAIKGKHFRNGLSEIRISNEKNNSDIPNVNENGEKKAG
ncbi:hypothetical protein GIB67_004428 [Kingdonia uniflora]|uniref:gibberellin 3beta-dioxygenase n=1 Tax=Kingdonia uniflora TaxID=39325 RepID=A0A7J7MRT8_9MAGN|nr:hypothetical protein GIB67_004428 [Kingdonia uniflora]